jgi:hypothetical protein
VPTYQQILVKGDTIAWEQVKMSKRKLSVSSTRIGLTYVYLYHAADWALEQATATEEGRFYNCMSSIVLSAFCIEAYLNHIGSELLPYWDGEFKRDISTTNKLKIICHHLNLTLDFSGRPFQSFNLIVKYRNLLAHATTVNISYQGTQTLRDGERVKSPESWWEKHTNLRNAKQWFDDTKAMITAIHQAVGKGDSPFWTFGTHGYHAKLA